MRQKPARIPRTAVENETLIRGQRGEWGRKSGTYEDGGGSGRWQRCGGGASGEGERARRREVEQMEMQGMYK